MKSILIVLLLAFAPQSYAANNILFGAPVTVTVTNSSTQELAANPLRSYLIMVNNSATVPVYVRFGHVQSGTEGVTIPPGGNYEPFEAPSNSVFMVTASSTASVTIIQGQ